MGLYAFYRNATPKLPGKEVSDEKEAVVTNTVKVPEHVVTVAKLDVELKNSDVRPVESLQTGEADKLESCSMAKQGKVEEKASIAV